MSTLLFLLPPMLACLLLVAMHTYFGLHVLRRGIVFVDIALAQMAALGMTVAVLLGSPVESQGAYLWGLAFTLFGAMFFATCRDNKISQEALIGVIYAVSAAAAILVADHLPQGTEHLKEMLSGNILWINPHALIKLAIIYALLGVLHLMARQKMILVSTQQETARAQGLQLWLWDFFFYASLGLVITSSVQIAGILLVFSFLIIPALTATLFGTTWRRQLIIGWSVGSLASLCGIAASYQWDLPTGMAMILALGGIFFVALLGQRLRELLMHRSEKNSHLPQP